jgi:hypothetical protein
MGWESPDRAKVCSNRFFSCTAEEAGFSDLADHGNSTRLYYFSVMLSPV